MTTLAPAGAGVRYGELHAPSPAWHRVADVVVIGTGAAGLSALLPLVAAGRRVEVVTRGALTETATDWAQGGLAAVWRRGDTMQAHVNDTLVAGAGLCEPDAVREVVREAPAAIRRLAGLGARFDRAADGDYDLHREGGHGTRRILHAGGDASGHEVERTLAAATAAALARTDLVRVSEHTRLVDVLTDHRGAACGVRVLDAGGAIGEILAPAVVLATGGAGQAWGTTTNPTVATGDGVVAALRAGAVVRDLEFMQFHPTLLVPPPLHRRAGDRGVLVSEAVRGEGAVLRDPRGAAVMRGVHPLGDLAPRDVVAAAMHAHMLRHGFDHLLLDGTGFGEAVWRAHFPTILAMCRERGVDPVSEPIPVRPGAHYLCGGVLAGLDGATSVPGLYVVGESASTGLHGANRLASNSLTEAVIMGSRCGELVAFAAPAPRGLPMARPDLALVDPSELAGVQRLMDAEVGVSRTASGLRDAAIQLARAETTDALSPDTLDATAVHGIATASTLAAGLRTESRGCHRRQDHPDAQAIWRRHLVLRAALDGLRATSQTLQPERISA